MVGQASAVFPLFSLDGSGFTASVEVWLFPPLLLAPVILCGLASSVFINKDVSLHKWKKEEEEEEEEEEKSLNNLLTDPTLLILIMNPRNVVAGRTSVLFTNVPVPAVQPPPHQQVHVRTVAPVTGSSSCSLSWAGVRAVSPHVCFITSSSGLSYGSRTGHSSERIISAEDKRKIMGFITQTEPLCLHSGRPGASLERRNRPASHPEEKGSSFVWSCVDQTVRGPVLQHPDTRRSTDALLPLVKSFKITTEELMSLNAPVYPKFTAAGQLSKKLFAYSAIQWW
ncbi:unnamed protein product [Pleuronectes platessa]|uniref:Uncharacterized protein n=1 Tax=Pleuronectes platessa TaxID=8262 RepID=A0A9N7TVT4_PLEPL|nr:unnamed protein product [Pleuronectes platessa]